MSTWGNAGYITYFRNRASSRFRTITAPYGNVAAVQLDARMLGMNVIGNVLGDPALREARYETAIAETCRATVPFVYRLNADTAKGYCTFASPPDRQTTETLLRHGNFDYVTKRVSWSPDVSERELPPSLYLREKPAFFGTGRWPWVDPTGTPRVHELPARKRFEALLSTRPRDRQPRAPADRGGETSRGRPRSAGRARVIDSGGEAR
jgi:hypothetical protein